MPSTPAQLVWVTIVAGTLIRILLAAVIGYGFGEGYYLATARHFALSYFDQPPLSLWIAWAMIKLFGVESHWLLRLPFILIFAATTWAMYRFAAMLFGERAGAWAAVVLNLSPLFTLGVAAQVQPDAPLMLFLLLAAIPVARIFFGPDDDAAWREWLLAGVALGLALLSKYHAVLIVAGLGLFLLTTPGYRHWLLRPQIYVAGLIAALIFAPVVIWNIQNDWVSFSFQSGRIVESRGVRFDWLLRSVLGQAVLLGPWLFPALVKALYDGARGGPRDVRPWFLFSLAVVPVVVFTIAAAWAPLGWHFHWQAPGYLFLFPLIGKATVELLDKGDRVVRWWLIGSTAVTLALPVILGTQAQTGWMRLLIPQSAAEVAGDNPLRETLDWTGLRQALAKRGLLDRPNTFAVAPQWHQTGKVDVQIGDVMPVVCLCGDPRNIAFGWNPNDFTGWDALIIGVPDYLHDVDQTYGDYFRSIKKIADVPILLGGHPSLTVEVYLGHDYDRPYPLPLPPE